ncbi:MAG TPA: permease prefix domain 1-containing protein [Verrucomicrobiae bacterium]|nr:permease prefix domain 1-containing protein [Verrucomicrobiae bacterium]
MFDLEKAIGDWRQRMLAAGIKTPVPLEELEIHLREEIERQMKSGLSGQKAFEISVRQIGQPETLKSEFKKIGTPVEMQKIIKLAGIVCVVVALFCPLFLFLPLLLAPELSLTAKMLGLAVYTVTVTAVVLSWRYNHKLLPVIRNQPLRRAVGIVCYGACLLWIRFGIFHFSPGGSHPRTILLPLFIFGLEWMVVAFLGGVGYGLEKAAHRQNTLVNE